MPEEQKIHAMLNELGKRTSGDIRADVYNRLLYSTDASIYQVMPLAVFLPRNIEEVQAAVELAAAAEVPLLPRTAGSSLAGQAVNDALVIDFTRHLDQILEVNEEERWVRVQPGIVLDELNLALQKRGLKFGPDPASSNRAAMGGIVSNNSTGAHSILYGMTADHVLETGVILSDGSQARFGPLGPDEETSASRRTGLEGDIYRKIGLLAADSKNQETIRRGTPRHWRRCGGYNLDRLIAADGLNFKVSQDGRFNLAKMVCGAEGTLAVITDIKLNLVPLPAKTALAIVHFDSLFDALKAVPLMLEVQPAAIELLDNLGLTLCRDVPEYSRLLSTFVDGHPNCVLITEFYGESEGELRAKLGALGEKLERGRCGATATVTALAPQLQDNVWKVRKVGLGLLMSIKGDHKPIPFIEDAAVPVDHLAEYVTKVERFCNDMGTNVAYYAHASAGCVHIRPLINQKKAHEIQKIGDIASFSVELLHGYGGSLSSEHGDGRVRSWLNESFFGPELYGLFRQVKAAFDPSNILNPGNIVDGPAVSEHLRYGEEYRVMPVKTHISFNQELGFDRAIEMCNGAGVCRKRTVDTMCPSFMVTREEEHSTRGRANLLRAAISGRLPASELTSERMFEAMALCVECKACKAECPSSVDMAKIKVEFLAQYQSAHGVPIRSRLFGDIARINRLGSGPLAPAANLLANNRVARKVVEKLIGIDASRPMPPFARVPFTTWFQRRSHENHNGSASNRPKVVLFNDTFNTYNYPGVAISATELLEAAGFEVLLPGHKCCGRPMISRGLIGKAREAARDTINRLAPFADQDIPIVGLEPSCLLTLHDEYAYLLPEDQRVERVAKYALTLEEFLAGLADAGELNLDFDDGPRKVLLHGHCHQKALVGTAPGRKALALPPGNRVTEVDSGCCGMAGSFGFEVENRDISMKMAERRLLPAVRAADQETVIVASGVSCRQQILYGSSRMALHPAELLHQQLRKQATG